MNEAQRTDSFMERDGSHFPRLKVSEWITFGVLAAALSVTNIYTTLLTGWGDTGSIIAVLAAVLILRVFGDKNPSIVSLNLGQTMASAGGSVGFSVASYAAVKMVNPEFDPSLPLLIIMFAAMGIMGAIIGTSVRAYMVRYFFPSGTACAVIQKSVTATGEESRRPIRLLAIWGSIASLVTIPTKITLDKGGHALLEPFKINEKIGVGVEPLLYGIGIVVGPRIGLGMLLGGLSAPYIIIPSVEDAGVDPSLFGQWVQWVAIAVLTIPTFATIAFAYAFRTPPVIPPGFEPGVREYQVPNNRNVVYAALGVFALVVTAFTGHILFDLPFTVTAITVAISWPLCVMNGRVTGDTDINPVRLVAIVLLTVFAWMVSGGAVTLLGMAIIGGTLAGIAVDMMQDYRTGYLVNANQHHQTSVQFLGATIGALVAVPFIMLIDSSVGFGPSTTLPAPGAQVWSAMAQAFAGDVSFSNGLIITVIAISVAGSAYALLTVWPKTAAFMPSLFGAGIGLLLPIQMSMAIFAGGMIKFAVTEVYKYQRAAEERQTAITDAGNDTMLIGSSIFAASAVISVMIVLITEIMRKGEITWFFMAGH